MSKINVRWEDDKRLIMSFEGIANPDAVALHMAKWLGQSQDETLIYIGTKVNDAVKSDKPKVEPNSLYAK